MKPVSLILRYSLPGLVLASGMLLLPSPAFGEVVSTQQFTISVDARFRESRLPALDLELQCKPGLPGQEEKKLLSDQAFDWKAQALPGKTSNCHLLARLPAGYTAAYFVGGQSQPSPVAKGCQFRGMAAGGHGECRLEVTQDPVDLVVYLEWIGPSGEEEDVRVSLECESGDYSGYRYVNAGQPNGWEIRDIDPEGILCNVSEEVRDNFRPDIIDCQGLWVLPGKGEECTLINTKIVKRIEMLNRYGLVVMIVLVLGIGLVAVRRFS
jgi:hypothetical protein